MANEVIRCSKFFLMSWNCCHECSTGLQVLEPFGKNLTIIIYMLQNFECK